MRHSTVGVLCINNLPVHALSPEVTQASGLRSVLSRAIHLYSQCASDVQASPSRWLPTFAPSTGRTYRLTISTALTPDLKIPTDPSSPCCTAPPWAENSNQLGLLVLQCIGYLHRRVLRVIELGPCGLALLCQPCVEFCPIGPPPVFGAVPKLVRRSRTFFSTMPFSQPLATLQNSGSNR